MAGSATNSALVIEPFLVSRPQVAGLLGWEGVQTLGEGVQQDRQRQERAGDFQKREPFGVVARDGGHGY